MMVLPCEYPAKELIEGIEEVLKKNKVESYNFDEIKAYFYTDGGAKVSQSRQFGGWGIHGYLYIDRPGASNSGLDKAIATKDKGYVNGKVDKDDKAMVVSYIDYYGTLLEATTNNIAELYAMIHCLRLIYNMGLKHVTIFADSQYVLNLLVDKQKYRDNGFKNSQGKELSNRDLIVELYDIHDVVETKTNLKTQWVKGHSGNYGNEKADDNATRARYIADNMLNKVSLLDEQTWFKVQTPDELKTVDYHAPKLMTESTLFFTTNGYDSRRPNVYYQASFGKGLKSKNSDEKKLYRGKPFSDCCISVILLNEPDQVTERLIQIANNSFLDKGVFETNLSNQIRKSIYNDLATGGINECRVDLERSRLYMPGNKEIASIISPVRQAFRLIDDFIAVTNFLSYYVDNKAVGIAVDIDITQYLYQVIPGKKKNTVKTIEYEEGYVSIPVNLGHTTVNIDYTIGVDCPNHAALNRMKDTVNEVRLVVWDITQSSFRYATVISTTEGIGCWMGIYSNLIIY